MSWSLAEFRRSFPELLFPLAECLSPAGLPSQQRPASPVLLNGRRLCSHGPEAGRLGSGRWRAAAPTEGSWDAVSRASPQHPLCSGHAAPLITRHFPCTSRVSFLTGHVGLGPPSPSVEEGMAIRSSLLAWRTPWTEEPGGLQSDTTERLGTRARSVVRPHLY